MRGEVLARLPYCKRHACLEEANVHQLAFAGFGPHVQRGECADRRVESAGEVADRDTDLDWIAANCAGDAHQPAASLRHDVQPWKMAEWTVLAPTRHSHVD